MSLEQHVTPDLIADIIGQVTGPALDIGPMPAGPGGVARVTARGVLRRAEVSRLPGDAVSFDARLPVALELAVEVAGGRQRYTAEVTVPIRVGISSDGDHALVDIARLRSRDVQVSLRPHGLQARLLAKVGDIEGQTRHEVATYVNARREGDDVQALRRIPLPG